MPRLVPLLKRITINKTQDQMGEYPPVPPYTTREQGLRRPQNPEPNLEINPRSKKIPAGASRRHQCNMTHLQIKSIRLYQSLNDLVLPRIKRKPGKPGCLLKIETYTAPY